MDAVKPYKVHTRVVIDMKTMQTREDEFYWSTVPPALMAGVDVAIILGAAAVAIGGASAVYSADRGRYSANMQQDYLLGQASYNQTMLDYGEQQRGLELAALYEQNAYNQSLAQMQEARYAMMMEMYGLQAEVAAGRYEIAGQRYEIAGQRYEIAGQMAEIAGQRWALEQEAYDWQIATIDWEADFKEEQARFIEEKGSIARSLFGAETAKLMARERARMAASGIQMSTGSPLAVLGQLAEEREYSKDVMKFETDINAWEQRFDKAQLLNQKNKVRFGEFGSGLDYQTNLLKYKGDYLDYKGDYLGYKGDYLGYQETLAGLGERAGEAGLGIAEARLKQGLLASQRIRIGQGAVIDLNKYLTSRQSAAYLTGMQSSVYGNAASAATVGGYLNTGAAIFNGFNSYYTATNKSTNYNSAYAIGGPA